MASESDYGSSCYRQFPPISEYLGVADGIQKPRRSRQKPNRHQPQGPGVINRGDRSGTIWAKKKKLDHQGQSYATLETSSMYPEDELWFENEDYTDQTDDSVIS